MDLREIGWGKAVTAQSVLRLGYGLDDRGSRGNWDAWSLVTSVVIWQDIVVKCTC